jgi:hypothetical protein
MESIPAVVEWRVTMRILARFMIASVVTLAGASASAEPAATPAPAASRALAIVAPVARQMLLANDGAVVVSLRANPPLAQDERIVLRIDDELVVLPSGTTEFAITDVPDGTHVIAAIVVGDDAKPVAVAESVSFDVRFGLRI